MKKGFLYWLLFFQSLFTLAQQPATTHSTLLTQFRFKQFFGGIVILKAKVNNCQDSLNFILDTGSSGISLDSSTVEELKLTKVPSDISIVGIAGTRVLSFVRNATLYLPGLTVPNLDFHIANYEVLSQTYGVNIDGIIGYSFLRQFIVSVDYDSLTIKIYSPGIFKYPRQGHTFKPSFTRIPVIDLYTNERRKMTTNYYFDIGAGLSLLLNEHFVSDSGFLRSKREPVTSQVEGLGGKAQMQLTITKQVKIGPYSFRNVPTYIFEDPNNVLAYPSLSGLIGNDILRRFNTVLNYPAREIHLVPNSHYNDLFDYSYSGLNIYFIDGRVVVGEVMQGSPAENAGFKPGDIIFGMGNDFSNNIQRYKEILQTPAGKINVIVLRNSAPTMIVLKVRKIK
ncbi:MAG: aspartyl protease family protein [Sphingobacteriales bacterium]|nr:aspartyl protease family protein [Sphingobacteriales bacterium]MBI3719029.1 aspartyl protease family protein [Sphingobacteriales bacterium]